MAKKPTEKTLSAMLGRKAPAFALPDQHGNVHRLADYKGRWVVLYAYPKDLTPGCSAQSCGFRDATSEFTELGAVVLGLSILDSKSKKKFAEKFGLNFPLLADEDHAVVEKYGLWKKKSMFGKAYMGISRETFIINPKGRVAAHWSKALGSEGHAPEVLAKLRELLGRK